jgi:F-type H+-transporting ATPase subunit delta
MTAGAAARRYARALFDVALAERADLEGISRDLSGVGDLVAAHAPLERVLSNPAIPAARKRGVMEQLLARAGVHPLVARVLLLLADRDRLALIPDLARQYRARLLDHQHVVRAELTTAMPLAPDRLAALQSSLAEATGRQVLLDVRVDPSIVGGAVARIGSIVYDGSITRQLEKLKEQLAQAGR